MRFSGRWPGLGPISKTATVRSATRPCGTWLSFRRNALVLRSLIVASALLFAHAAALSREVSLQGSIQKGYVRIELRFDETTKVNVRATNGVVVVGFESPTRIKQERLTAELGAYISVVRRDPDDTGLRIALVTPVRTSVLQAGERVFIDLLPPTWTGLPPGLPPDVVEALAARARDAERKLRESDAGRAAPRKSVMLRLAERPALTRLVFEPPAGTPMGFKEADGALDATFGGRLSLDEAGAKAKSAAGIADLVVVQEEGSLAVNVTPEDGYAARGFVEDDTLVVDVARLDTAKTDPGKPDPLKPDPLKRDPGKRDPGKADSSRADPNKPDAGKSDAPRADAAKPGAVRQAAPVANGRRPAPQDADTPEAGRRPDAPMTTDAGGAAPPVVVPAAVPPSHVVPVVERSEEASSILFPFRNPTPAAAFDRGGRITIVFGTQDDVVQEALAGLDPRLGRIHDIRPETGLFVLRLTLPEGSFGRLVPAGSGWRVVVSERPGMPSDVLPVSRGSDQEGNPEVVVGLTTAAAVNWINQDGTRVAVVTALGRPQGLPTGRRFVEFDLLASLHGVAVAAKADDLSVGLGKGGVMVSSRTGLSLSSLRDAGETGAAAALVISRDHWVQDGGGPTGERYRDLVTATADAPRSGRSDARFRLARFLLANGLSAEATSLMTLARQEDATFARQRETLLLSGIAAVRAHRLKEAREHLAGEALSDDPEGRLWRAVIDGEERQWARALAGFRRSADTLTQYPVDLSGEIRFQILTAALEAKDMPAAESAMAAIDRLPIGSIPRDQHDFARARLDEAAGRPDAALAVYDRLAEDASRPIAAEAEVRRIAIANRSGRMPVDQAQDRLENLAVSWRGDETELRTLVELARIYSDAGKWREMFAITRRANLSFPKADMTRALHDDTTRRFEALLLGEGAAKLSAVDTLAIYYDFKEFAPIGRRGDEIVRRLADRLVELDLLDQAAELLQHQVDKRLTGAARSAVAARLAAIRLLNGKPLLAIAVLHATRLGELPADLRRFRLMLEAQAQADLTRTDLALEMLEGEAGPAFARMRAGILFGARRWREAGEAFEAMIGTRWQGPDALSDRDRQDIVRATVASLLADEPLALDRVKAKFAAKMADSPDAKTFVLLMRPNVVRMPEFRTVLREAGKIDTLRQLLDDQAAGRPMSGTPMPEADARTEPTPVKKASAG